MSSKREEADDDPLSSLAAISAAVGATSETGMLDLMVNAAKIGKKITIYAQCNSFSSHLTQSDRERLMSLSPNKLTSPTRSTRAKRKSRSDNYESPRRYRTSELIHFLLLLE